MKTTIYIILAAVSAMLVSGGCETLQNLQTPKASLSGIKLEKISLDSATLVFDVEIENPYAVALPVANIDYDVTSNSNRLFSGKADVAGIVPARSKATISMPATVSYLDVARAFKGVSPGSKVPYKADAGLSVDAPVLGTMRLPLNKTGELDVPALPKAGDVEKMILDKIKQ